MHWDQIKGERIQAPSDSQLSSLELSDTARALRDLPDLQRPRYGIAKGHGEQKPDEDTMLANTGLFRAIQA